MILQPNVFSYLFLFSALVSLILYFILSKTKSKSRARKYYNYVVLSDVLWMFADFIQYSSVSAYLSRLFLVVSFLFITFSLLFLTKLILAFEKNEDKDWVSLIPLFLLILLFPFFDIKAGVYTTFIENPSLSLIIFNFVIYSFF